MKERPILFSGPMVRAILDGRKTQTRRVWRYQPLDVLPMRVPDEWITLDTVNPNHGHVVRCRFGRGGDRLWVRETWGAVWPNPDEPAELRDCHIEYRADLPEDCTDYPGQWPAEDARGNDDAPKWRSPMHMPRWASRLTLEIKAVRVERLQAITVRDAIEETGALPALFSRLDPRDYFAHVWNAINGKRAPWASNPWVWVIELVKATS